ncbi:hypothetical protein [uncultured Kordia sp.]|uniref:hypothetical protein n=1 Tax=uncultured Kordia sp. TaxID=507699 RepID=UPI00261CFF50|nr:hypothetical protein [uncultured Kordia sp.]
MKKTFLKRFAEKSIQDTSLLNAITGGDDGQADKKKVKIPSNGDNPDDEVSDGE